MGNWIKRRTYQEEIEIYPRDSEGYGMLGVVYAERGQYEKAVELERQAVRLAPDMSGVRRSRQLLS